MDKQYTNPCSRCGKERIIAKSWVEKNTTFSGDIIEIRLTENVCPDKECQKVLDVELALQKAKRAQIAKNREQRALENKAKKGGLRIRKNTENNG